MLEKLKWSLSLYSQTKDLKVKKKKYAKIKRELLLNKISEHFWILDSNHIKILDYYLNLRLKMSNACVSFN